MLKLEKILNQDHQSNTQRKMRWAWDWREEFGTFPDFGPCLVRHCRICKKPVWIKPLDDINPLNYTCSEQCDQVLDELRRENHWS